MSIAYHFRPVDDEFMVYYIDADDRQKHFVMLVESEEMAHLIRDKLNKAYDQGYDDGRSDEAVDQLEANGGTW